MLTSKLFSNIGLRYKQIVEDVGHLTMWSVFPECCRYGITINTKKTAESFGAMDGCWMMDMIKNNAFVFIFVYTALMWKTACFSSWHKQRSGLNSWRSWIMQKDHLTPDHTVCINNHALIIMLDISYRYFTRMTRHQTLMN